MKIIFFRGRTFLITYKPVPLTAPRALFHSRFSESLTTVGITKFSSPIKTFLTIITLIHIGFKYVSASSELKLLSYVNGDISFIFFYSKFKNVSGWTNCKAIIQESCERFVVCKVCYQNNDPSNDSQP